MLRTPHVARSQVVKGGLGSRSSDPIVAHELAEEVIFSGEGNNLFVKSRR
jgi:hypothetical protein